MLKKYKHIRISEDLFLKIKDIAKTTYRSVGLTAEMLLDRIIDSISESSHKDEARNDNRIGGEL